MIGILGGTFDPIHYGHLRTALDVQEELGLERIHFVPLKQAVHREQPGTAAELRASMVQAAIAQHPGFVMDDRELHNDRPSYSLYTLQSFRRQMPHTPLCFLLGMDAFRDFLNWHQPIEILKLAHLVVMHRPGEKMQDEQLQQLVAERSVEDAAALHQQPGGSILFQPVTQLAISATDIRRRAQQGRSLRYLLPDAVITIVEQLKLYRPA
ncbi:MAG: nicotinate-nucleotide adenylyltransferase [Gammaproteobacteria bacterium]|nr:nicotinate-nucleotide adenylyltransferase [Gammaproteobacteria bacterium]